jgi:hypothetical protein
VLQYAYIVNVLQPFMILLIVVKVDKYMPFSAFDKVVKN